VRQRNVAEQEPRSRTPEIHGAVTYHSQRVPGFRGPGLEHFGERSAIRSNTNSLQYNVRMMAIFLGRILLFDHGIATAGNNGGSRRSIDPTD
jgi:hypothetical protein